MPRLRARAETHHQGAAASGRDAGAASAVERQKAATGEPVHQAVPAFAVVSDAAPRSNRSASSAQPGGRGVDPSARLGKLERASRPPGVIGAQVSCAAGAACKVRYSVADIPVADRNERAKAAGWG